MLTDQITVRDFKVGSGHNIIVSENRAQNCSTPAKQEVQHCALEVEFPICTNVHISGNTFVDLEL